jgi:hypothetical protein
MPSHDKRVSLVTDLAPRGAPANSSAMHARVGLLVLVTSLFSATGCASARRAPSVPEDATSRKLAVGSLTDSITAILRAGVRDSAFPAAVAVVGTRYGAVATSAAGQLDWASSPAPSDSTLWDLASLTKVVGLTSAMLLVESRAVDLDAGPLPPEFRSRWGTRDGAAPPPLERAPARAVQGVRESAMASRLPRCSTPCRASNGLRDPAPFSRRDRHASVGSPSIPS